QPEVRLPLSDLSRVFAGRPPIDIANTGESLCAQQILREALRGNADGPGISYNPHSGCFEDPLCGRQSRDVQEAGRARQCNAADEPASVLDDRHWKPPLTLVAHPFSSRLSSFKKRQSVPSAMIFCGLDLMRPTSCRRSA